MLEKNNRANALKSLVRGGRMPDFRFELHKCPKIFQIWNAVTGGYPLLSM
jgi:hypothetical protein